MKTGGIGGHHRAVGATDEWLTPPAILAALGPFDLDPCAPVARPWPTAARHFSVDENGLLLRWQGRVWLNPPYGPAISRWMARMAEHGCGTALVFARTETEWFFSSVWRAATALLFLGGRLNFHLPDGTRSLRNAGGPSVLIAYGRGDADRLAAAELDGAFVPLAGAGRLIAVLEPVAATWAELLEETVRRAGGAVDLAIAYVLVGDHPKALANRHWRAKVRQTLQGPAFRRVGRAAYELAV